jgi:hypothetical protein
MTTDQVLNQSGALYRTILLSEETPHITGSRMEMYRQDGSLQHHWVVQAGEAPDTPQIVFDWNADKGELVRVVSGNPSFEDQGRPVLSRGEAVYKARFWLCALGMAATAPQWKLAGEPNHSPNGKYTVCWRALDRETVVMLRDRTGALTQADMRYKLLKRE